MIESKLRKEDVRLADLVSSFLDEHFYNEKTVSFERVEDRARQVQGLDVIFDMNGEHYECDEKNGGTRINTNLRTFSLELSFINRGGFRNVGWFLNQDLKNDSYMLIWPDKADTDKPQTVDEIREVEIALVRKDKLKKYLEEHGITISKLQNITNAIINRTQEAETLRKRDKYGNVIQSYDGKLKYEIGGLTFCHSTQLVESPVNLILPREVYREIADYNTIIYA
jgi:hypothetical protein